MGFSKTSEKCKACVFYSDCDSKEMEACAYLIPPAQAVASEPLLQDIVVKHDYRDVKVAEGMTVSIDLEEVKRKLSERFSCSFNNFLQNGR